MPFQQAKYYAGAAGRRHASRDEMRALEVLETRHPNSKSRSPTPPGQANHPDAAPGDAKAPAGSRPSGGL